MLTQADLASRSGVSSVASWLVQAVAVFELA
jgi:hypothetical protein